MPASYLNVEAVLPEECERARAQASLALDCELSEHERAQLCAHLARCADCSAFVGGLRNLTLELRSAPLPAPSRPVALPGPRRRSRRPVLLAAFAVVVVAAAAAGGIGTHRPDARHVVAAARSVARPLPLPGARFPVRVPV